MTLQPARFSNEIASATPGRKWKSSQRVTYWPSAALRLITPSRSKNTARFIQQLQGEVLAHTCGNLKPAIPQMPSADGTHRCAVRLNFHDTKLHFDLSLR